MYIESGIIIFIGMLLLGLKLPKSVSLRLLGRPLLLDVVVTVLAFAMHYGTFTGVMAAAVAGLFCSGFTSAARYVFGYIEHGTYHSGRIWRVHDPFDQKRGMARRVER